MTPEEINRTVSQLLDQAPGRSTRARESVLNILLSAPTALNHHNIEEVAKQRDLSIDRVTLYRTLDWLVEQGVAHRIASVNRSWYFSAVAQPDMEPHAHFHCKKCQQIYCLEDVQAAPMHNLPKEYQLEEADLCLQGQCVTCNRDANG